MADDIVDDPNPRPQCDHICLQVEGHDGPHFYGYLFPSPVRELERLQAEIERLRTAGDALAEFIGRRAGSSDKSHIRDEADEVCLLWEDAVKGGEFWEARREQ